jgi:hypothetical protein
VSGPPVESDADHYFNATQRMRDRAQRAEAELATAREALRRMIAVTEMPGTRSELSAETENAKSFARAALSGCSEAKDD